MHKGIVFWVFGIFAFAMLYVVSKCPLRWFAPYSDNETFKRGTKVALAVTFLFLATFWLAALLFA